MKTSSSTSNLSLHHSEIKISEIPTYSNGNPLSPIAKTSLHGIEQEDPSFARAHDECKVSLVAKQILNPEEDKSASKQLINGDEDTSKSPNKEKLPDPDQPNVHSEKNSDELPQTEVVKDGESDQASPSTSLKSGSDHSVNMNEKKEILREADSSILGSIGNLFKWSWWKTNPQEKEKSVVSVSSESDTEETYSDCVSTFGSQDDVVVTETAKTEQVAKNSKLGSLLWLASMTPGIKQGVNAYAITLPSQAVQNSMVKELKTLLGSDELQQVIKACNRMFADMVIKSLLKKDFGATYTATIKAFVHNNKEKITSLTEILLIKFFLNISKTVKVSSSVECSNPAATSETPVTFIQIISFILGKVESAITKSEKQDDEQVLKIFKTTVKELFKLGFPRREKDLFITSKFSISKTVWDSIIESVTLDLKDLYFECKLPLNLGKDDALEARIGGSLFVQLSLDLEKKSIIKLPSIIASNDPLHKIIIKYISTHVLGHVETTNISQEDSNSESGSETSISENDTTIPEWFKTQLILLCQSDDSKIKLIWKLAGSYLKPILTNVFYHLSNEEIETASFLQNSNSHLSNHSKGTNSTLLIDETDALIVIVKKLHKVLSGNCYVDEQSLNVSSMTGTSLKDIKLVFDWQKLTDDLLEALGLGEPSCWQVPKLLQKLVYGQAKKLIPGLLKANAQSFAETDFNDEETRKKMCAAIFDRRTVENGALSQTLAQKMNDLMKKKGDKLKADDVNQLRWKLSGTTETVKVIESMTGAFACDIVDQVFSYFQIKEMAAAGEEQTLDNSKEEKLTNENSLQDLQIEEVFNQENSVNVTNAASLFNKTTNIKTTKADDLQEHKIFTNELRQFLTKWIDSSLKHMIINLIKIKPKFPIMDEDHLHQYIMAELLISISKIIEDNIDEDFDKKYLAIVAMEDSPDKIEQMRALFIPLANSIVDLIGMNPLELLPIVEIPNIAEIKKEIWDSVALTIIPDILVGIYSKTMSMRHKHHEAQKNLESIYKTTHPKFAVQLIAQFTKDFSQDFVANKSDETANLLLDAVIGYLKHEGASQGVSKPVPYLEDSKSKFVPFISKNLKRLKEDFISEKDGEKVDTHFQGLWESIYKDAEGFIAEFLSGLSTNISKIEKEEPMLIINLASDILEETAKYFNMVNSAASKMTPVKNHLIPTFADLQKIHSNSALKLHDAIPVQELEFTLEAQDKHRLKKFFMPLAKKVIALSGIDLKEFPVPYPFTDVAGELFQETILPMILLNSFKRMLEPDVRNNLMSTFVETLYTTLNSYEKTLHAPVEQVQKELTEEEKALCKKCGEVVLQIVQLIPDTVVQYVFMKKKFLDLGAEAVGKAMMPFLNKNSIIKVIDKLIFFGLLSFHPSKWDGKEHEEELIPMEQVVGAGGTIDHRTKADKQFSFSFQTDVKEGQPSEKLKIQEAEKVRKKLVDSFTRTISTEMRKKAWEIMVSNWDHFQMRFDDYIELKFPTYGARIKSFFDTMCSFIFFKVFGRVFLFMVEPLTHLLQLIIEKTYISKHAEGIILNLHAETMEHLIYSATDKLFDRLKTAEVS